MNMVTATPARMGLVQLSVLDDDDNIVSMNAELADFLGLPRDVSGVKVPGLCPDGKYAMHYRLLQNLRKTGQTQGAVIFGYSTSNHEGRPDTLRYNEIHLSTARGHEGQVIWVSFNLTGLSESLIDLITEGGALHYSADSLPASGATDQ